MALGDLFEERNDFAPRRRIWQGERVPRIRTMTSTACGGQIEEYRNMVHPELFMLQSVKRRCDY